MHDRYSVIGCKINRLTMAGALDSAIERACNEDGGYICFANVHACVTARERGTFMKLINNSFMSLPDGKPVYWVGKFKGCINLEQIPGPDFFLALLKINKSPSLRHYFYGGSQEVLDKLFENIKTNNPKAQIVGTESPPFRKLSDAEIECSLNRIRAAKPNFVWVGLGAPKQEIWMEKHWEELKPAVLLGVGAAFDFHAGAVQRAPRWVQHLGLEWLHRLLQEPGRLWKRYFYTNSMFLFYLAKDIVFKN